MHYRLGLFVLMLALMMSSALAQSAPPTPRPIQEILRKGTAPTVGAPALRVNPGHALTTDDVRAYMTTHPLPGTLPALSHRESIASIDLVSAADASKRLGGERLGVPGDRMVFVAIQSGDFAFPMPTGEAIHYPVAAEVFDAVSGNVLLTAGLSSRFLHNPPP